MRFERIPKKEWYPWRDVSLIRTVSRKTFLFFIQSINIIDSMSADNNLDYDIPVFRTLPEILRDSDDGVNEKDDLRDISVEKLYQLETFESNEEKEKNRMYFTEKNRMYFTEKNRMYFIILFFAIVFLIYFIWVRLNG